MKSKILRFGDKVIVKTNQAEPSDRTIRMLQRVAGCPLNYCAFRNGGLILWNGPSNVRVAGWAKAPKRLRSETGFNFVDADGHQRVPEICRELQRRIAKIRYAKKWTSRVYENIVRPRANGQTVCAFTAPTLP